MPFFVDVDNKEKPYLEQKGLVREKSVGGIFILPHLL
jgi:hypothetical protein